MGLFGKLFGSNNYNAQEPQGHLKTKNYKKLDWEIDENEYTKQDYIASTEYIIPSRKTLSDVLEQTENGREFVVRDVFFRVDYMGHADDWYKQRDYLFHTLNFKKKKDESGIYILEGSGIFLKEDFTGTQLESDKHPVSVYAEIRDKNKKIEIQNARGFDDTDNWYAFMLLFKILEYYKYPTDTCQTVSAVLQEKN